MLSFFFRRLETSLEFFGASLLLPGSGEYGKYAVPVISSAFVLASIRNLLEQNYKVADLNAVTGLGFFIVGNRYNEHNPSATAPTLTR